MGSNRSVLGLTLPLLVPAVPSALVSAGATRAGSFVDAPVIGLDLNLGSLCAHTVDYNSDGWPDLLVCGETGGLHLFDNDQGQGFTNVSSIPGAQVNVVDAAMVDVNRDGRPDLITLTGTKVAGRRPGPIQLLTPQPTSMGARTPTVSFHSALRGERSATPWPPRYSNQEHD